MKGASMDVPLDPAALELAGAKGGSSAVAGVILAIVHALAFAPLAVIVALQDVHLHMAVVLNTSLCICLAVGNLCFSRMGVVKVYPKSLDTFLLVLYAGLIPVSYMQRAWLTYWLSVVHSAAVACFMWLSVLLPCCSNFVAQAVRDNYSWGFCRLPATQRATLHTAQAWATALTLMALAALGPTLSGRTRLGDPVHIACDYVLGALPLCAAALVHYVLVCRGLAHGEQRWQQDQRTEPDAVGVAVALPWPVAGSPRSGSSSGGSSGGDAAEGRLQDAAAQAQAQGGGGVTRLLRSLSGKPPPPAARAGAADAA